MGTDWEAVVRRLARLARLSVSEAEAPSLALRCAEITDTFAALREHAADLPPVPAAGVGALRPDADEPAPSGEVEGIRAAVPALDGPSGAVKVPRGLP